VPTRVSPIFQGLTPPAPDTVWRADSDNYLVYIADDRIRQARLLYEQAVFSGDERPLTDADRVLDSLEADLAVARGRLVHTRFLLARDADRDQVMADPGELALFERAVGLYRELGDLGGEAEALFWVGCFHQIVQRDAATAVPIFERSLELATQAADKATMSEALRHLGICAHATAHQDLARLRLEESTKLRRQIGLLPGVAANLVGWPTSRRPRGVVMTSSHYSMRPARSPRLTKRSVSSSRSAKRARTSLTCTAILRPKRHSH
jgi:hypothetical protein